MHLTNHDSIRQPSLLLLARSKVLMLMACCGLLQRAAQATVDALYVEADARDAAADNSGLMLGPLAAALE